MIIFIVIGVTVGILGILIWHTIDKFQIATDSKEEWKSSYGEIYKGISYGEKSSNVFDLYIPANADNAISQGIILNIHGGGWSGGKRQSADALCKRYAKAGYITATMDYTLLKEGDDVCVSIFNMIDEINDCIKQIKITLDEKGYTAGKIALAGTSAGGHLALLYSYSRAENSAIPLAFVVSQCGPTSVEYWLDATTEYGAKAIQELSPIEYVSSNAVPTLFSHGQKDSIVPYEATTNLIEKLKEYDIPYQFVDFPNSNHTHESDPESHLIFREKMVEFCKEYFGY